MVDIINRYGLFSILILIFLEYACFPLPSEILLPLSGGISKQLGIPFFVIVLSSSVSALLGALGCYMIGYRGGGALLERLQKKFPKMRKGIDASKEKYLRHANLSTLFGRLIPICRTYISFIAGIYRQNLKLYLLTTFIGATIWNAILLGLGYYTISNVDQIKYFYQQYRIWILIVIMIGIICYIIGKEIRHKRLKK